jgi:hypothetical protein
MNESFKIFSSTIKEVATLQQRLESSYDEIGEVLGKYYEIKEGNEFGAERAKAIASGDDSFNVGGKTYKVTDVDPADKKNAEEFVGENMSNMKLGSLLKNKKRVNEAKVIVYNEKTGERYEVLSGKGKGDLLIAMKALQSSAPSHMKYSIKENRRVNEAADKPHIKKIDSNLYIVDTPFVQYSSKFGNLIHIGGGDFTLETPDGKVYFTRALERTDPALPVSVGRVHSMDGDAAAVKKVVALMSKKYKLDGESSSELPKATIPAAIEQRLALAIEKIESGKLNFNQKIGILAKVVDALNVDKTQLGTLTSKIKSKMESYQAPEEVTEGNEFGAERAKAIAAGKDSFTVDGKTYKVTDVDPADKKNAEEFTNESMRLTNLLKKKSLSEATARLSDLLKQVANGSTSRIGSTKVDKKTAEKLLKLYNSGDVKMQNKFDGMSIDKVTSAFKPFMENNKLKNESAPDGWEGTVKAMKDEPGIDNPWALAWWMKGKGYQSHKK